MPTLLDQAGDSALLLRSKPGVFAGQNLSGVRDVAGKSFIIEVGQLVGVLFPTCPVIAVWFTHEGN